MYASSTGTGKSSHGQVNFINKTSVAEKRLNKALAPENLRFESDLNPGPQDNNCRAHLSLNSTSESMNFKLECVTCLTIQTCLRVSFFDNMATAVLKT